MKKRSFTQKKVNEFFEKSSNSMEDYLKRKLGEAKSPAEKKRIKELLKDFS